MRLIAATTIVLILVNVCVCYSQEARHTKSKGSRNLRSPSISKAKSRVICPTFEQSAYPYQAFGFKLGDPVALTYKYYPNDRWAFAADVGKVASGLYSKYYRKNFQSYIPDTLSGEKSIRYLSHRALQDWYFEAKVLHQWNASKISPGLQLYAGLGWQWRSTKLEYSYIYENGPFNSNLGNFKRSRFTYGPTAIVGFEYSYFSLPLSAFIEIEMFTDALLDPGYNRFQGGVGLRYVF